MVTAFVLGMGMHGAPAGAAHAAGTISAHDKIYAGLQNGYIYTSTDRGASWREADTGLPTGVDVTALAAAPGGSGTVYAGTAGSGVFVAIDDGRYWQDDNGGDLALAGSQVRGLVVDPRNGQVVYVATTDGVVFRTADGGRNWSPNSLPVGSQITTLAIDPRRASTLLAGTAGDGVLISSDGGASWNAPSADIPHDAGVNGLAFSASNADVAYAATDDGIYQTIDGGASWQIETRGVPEGTGLQSVATDPVHGSRVLAGGADGQIYRSLDGGTSWQEVADAGRQVSALLFDPARRDTALAGTADGGWLYVGGDDGANWQESYDQFAGGNRVLCLAVSLRVLAPVDPVNPPIGHLPGVRYFPASQHTVRGTLLQFYDRYGGLKIIGLPLSEAFVEQGRIVQFFERARLALAGGQVHADPLGSLLTVGRRFHAVAPFRSTAHAMYFPDTGHSLRGSFLAFWQHHHGQLLFGAPISEPLYEQNGDGTGRTYLVQYFQNARMEYHPELSGTRYEVTLGLLGRQYLQQRGWL